MAADVSLSDDDLIPPDGTWDGFAEVQSYRDGVLANCFLQVFLTTHTSRRACSTPACDRRHLRQRTEHSDI